MPVAPTSARAGGSTSRLLDRRLVFVTGKGGVGKSTVAAALGIVAARRGLRTIVAEVARRADIPRALADGFGEPLDDEESAAAGSDAGSEHQLAANLFAISIDPHQALREYLLDRLPVRALAELLGSSRTFSQLTAATPGMSELLTIGKVWELAQPRRRVAGGEPFDVVIVDAPATGYGVAYLAAPRTFAGVAQVGPIARQGRQIHATLASPQLTAVVAVTTAEEAAITEVLELGPTLREQMGIEVERVIVNALHPWRFAPRERARLSGALSSGAVAADERAALRIALAEDARVRSQRAALRRLHGVGANGPLQLPFDFAEELGRVGLERLADVLEPDV